jgi:DNA-binding CsgD family transcriptional regulator
VKGRDAECESLNRLLDAVRAGESRVLVVRGEEGVGKTALLQYLQDQAADCRVARATGVQSEMELAFAGVHQLCARMLDRLDRLPDPQREALAIAFGLSAGDAPDRFLLGLAVLTLLSEVAEERPLVCLVDDAQWLDEASAQTLAFVARRLQAESVALVFAVRGDREATEFARLPELTLGGLSPDAARALLASAVPGALDERVAERIVAETAGNPLALLELPRGLSPAELAGGFSPLDARPLSGRIEESFRRRLAELPDPTRLLLLVAAAEPLGEPVLVWRAAENLGIGGEAAAPAVASDLVELGARVQFRHPLVRSAIYGAASPEERRAVHGALAEATDPEADPDRRAWHRAHAAAGPDEDVAAELERCAGRARARGGFAAAAAFHERAAALTVEPACRAERALAAAQAKHLAGAPDAALEVLAAARAGPLNELGHVQADLLRARIAFAVNRGRDAPPLLLTAARRLEPLDPQLARGTYLDALSAATFVGRLADGPGLREVAEAARSAPPPPEPPRAVDLLLDGLALMTTEGPAAGAPTLGRAVSAFLTGESSAEEEIRWLWLAVYAALDLWDDEAWHALAVRHVRLLRGAGALAMLPIALNSRIGAYLGTGELGEAELLVKEVTAVTRATGTHLTPYIPLALAAYRGREAEASRLLDDTMNEVLRRGEGIGLTISQWAGAVLYNGLGRYEDALAAAEPAEEHPEELRFHYRALVELIEAAARSGKVDRAAAAVERLSRSTRAGGTDFAMGTEARSRALVSEGDAAESAYREAIERLARTRPRTALARAHLVYGEWLRRERRRVDAREQLRTAHEMLAAMGMEAFAGRAARELRATGETARKRTVETRDRLTPQEAHIARLAREGYSNPEIGAQLFISPRTVKYHLHKVFAKLDIRSRSQLEHVLTGDHPIAGFD